MTCQYCEKYFERWSCGANRDTGECDCPKCQGLCECDHDDEEEVFVEVDIEND